MLPKLPIVLLCAASSAVLAAQVNFYFDDNCQEYANTVELQDWVESGGAYGSRSVMFIGGVDPVHGTWWIASGDGQYTWNPRVWSPTQSGQCVFYPDGITAGTGVTQK